MKTIKGILTLIIFSVFIIQPILGQNLLKRISDKTLKKAEQRFEKKADEKIDKELDKVEEKLEKDTEEEIKNSNNNNGFDLKGIMSSMGLSGEPVPIADSYEFNHLIQMHIESLDKNGKKESEGEFVTHLNSNTKCMAYQPIGGDMAKNNQGLFIVDMENEAMIMLNEEKGKKNGIVYGMKGFMQSMGETYDPEELEETPKTYLENPNVSKTGRTKTIAGLKCEEFIYKDENTESNIWITKDMKLNTKDFFSTIFKTSMYSHGMGWGYLMEATSINKENGKKSVMQVTRIDENSNVRFLMSSYEITNMGSINLPVE